MAVQNSVRSYLGIAKEVTKGTVVAPTDFIPVTASKMKDRKSTRLNSSHT